MRRWTLRILICLVLGSVTTVAVAWGLVILIDTEFPEQPTRLGGSLETPRVSWVAAEQRSGSACLFTSVWFKTTFVHAVAQSEWDPREIIPEWTGFSNPVDLAGVDERFVADVADCRGWPYLALWSHSTHAVRVAGVDAPPSPRGGLPVGLPPTQNMYGIVAPRLPPLRPIWPGFLIDALFYGAIWFGMIFGLGAVRRALRTRRGRCPMCGYDLRRDLDAGCPECGWGREWAES